MSRFGFSIVSPPTNTAETRASRKRKLTVLSSPEPCATTIVDTPSRHETPRGAPLNTHDQAESIDNEEPVVNGSNKRTNRCSNDKSSDSAESSIAEADETDLVPTERIALALERIARMLEPLQPLSTTRRRTAKKTLVDIYLNEIWNINTNVLNVEHSLDRYELEVLGSVAKHVHTCIDGPAIEMTGEAIMTKQYRASSTSCVSCSRTPTTTSNNTLCTNCMRCIALIRSVINALVLRNTMGIKAQSSGVMTALADLEKHPDAIRVKRDL